MDNAQGQPQSYTVAFGAFDSQTSICGAGKFNSYPFFDYSVADVRPISLTLPNGKMYQFTWQNDSMFKLTGITLPTQDSITYTYGTFRYGRCRSLLAHLDTRTQAGTSVGRSPLEPLPSVPEASNGNMELRWGEAPLSIQTELQKLTLFRSLRSTIHRARVTSTRWSSTRTRAATLFAR